VVLARAESAQSAKNFPQEIAKVPERKTAERFCEYRSREEGFDYAPASAELCERSEK
jgi:hypothetical protein